MIDLSQNSVVDDHCHPFLPWREDKEFHQLFNYQPLACLGFTAKTPAL